MSKGRKLNLQRNLFVIFCDDLRQEVNGKITIVGAYQTKMIFPHFPAVQPRLGAFMHASSIGDPFQKLTFNLYKDDELLESMNIETDGQKPNELQVALLVGPLTFESSCTLRTELVTESETIAGRSLEVLAMENLNSEPS